MGVFARSTKSPKAVFLCIFGYAMFLGACILVQEQTSRRRLVTYDQQIDEFTKLFPTSPLFKLREITESDVRLWQGKFYSSLASVTRSQSENVTKWKALALYHYNKSHLSDINQITVPGNKPGQIVKTTIQNGLLQFLETASCQPITPDVVVYDRVFKQAAKQQEHYSVL